MSEMDYHDAHAPYIEAVAEALEAAGIGVEDWFADANDPRDGCITLAERDKDGDAHYVAWNEEKGWFYGTGPENDPINTISWICDDVLPKPDEVVAAARARTAATTRDRGYYRHFEDGEDGFEERLAAYHPTVPPADGEQTGGA